ncbi:hypothetical protein GCM10028808_74560 [Spirosoma migulaei]
MLIKRIKQLLKLIGLVCLITLALCGIGIGGVGPVLSPSRERYIDNGIKTEFLQTKGDEGDSMEEEESKC